MSFQQVSLEWNGETFVIEPKGVMQAIAVVEEIVSLSELSLWSLGRKDANLSRLAKAYSALLTYAGCEDADWESVYQYFFIKGQDGRMQSVQAIYGLLSLMVPPTHLQDKGAGSGASSKKPNGRRASSKSPTSSPAGR